MSHYKANLRDLEFNLFELFGRQHILGTGPYADVDAACAADMLVEVARLATDELADSMVDADRNPPVFDPHASSVKLPASLVKAYEAYVDAEWWRLDVSPALGGTAVPSSLRWALAELVLGANPAIHMYSSGFGFAKILYALGTDAQKTLAARMVDGHWGATMVLTEPDAGSDVGAGRVKAVPQADGTWHISGVKRFITGAEADLFDNIVHFVLARPVGAGPGTKGLSLFVVPKFHVDAATGALGERNGVYVTNVEHKMGLKASTTCEVTFGDREPAVGTLVGGVHDGIAQMFKIIEFARMMVGTKAIATLSTGYLNALEYAKARIQGADLAAGANKVAPRVAITAHPDVRRSLMLAKAYSEGLRSLVIYTACQQDEVDLAAGGGAGTDSDAAMAAALNDLLLPIVKGAGSERAWVLLGTECLQTFGGSGFLADYPLEQYVRDAKIDTLYEGTTAIQGLDFFFRKIVRDQGRALGYLAAQVGQFAAGAAAGFQVAERVALARALGDVQTIVAVMFEALLASDPRAGGDPVNVYKVGQNASRLLLAAGDLVVGWLLLRSAVVARAALDAGTPGAADVLFYEGKIAAASFFATNVLPLLGAQARIAKGVDNSLMGVPEGAF